jgi:hypothetical protein
MCTVKPERTYWDHAAEGSEALSEHESVSSYRFGVRNSSSFAHAPYGRLSTVIWNAF